MRNSQSITPTPCEARGRPSLFLEGVRSLCLELGLCAERGCCSGSPLALLWPAPLLRCPAAALGAR